MSIHIIILVRKLYFIFLSVVLHTLSVYSQTEHAVVEYYNENITVTKKGYLINDISYAITIFNKNADRYATVRIPHSPLSPTSRVRAYVTNSNQEIIKTLKRNSYSVHADNTDYSLFTDRKYKVFRLEHHSYPYTIHVSYRKREKQYVQITDFTQLFYSLPCKEARLQITTPYGFFFNHYEDSVFSLSKQYKKKEIIFDWHATNLEKINRHRYAPSPLSIVPKVIITPQQIRFDKPGSFKTWADLGDWIYRINQGKYSLPESEVRIVTNLIADVECVAEKVKRIFYYVQDHTRYISVSDKMGGIVPFSASYVSSNKFGDCKALSIYLIALLKQVDIEAFYTLIYSGGIRPYRFNTTIPSFAFDHAIVAVPINGDTIYLDPTTKYSFDFRPAHVSNRYCLIVKSNQNSVLQKTPTLSSYDVQRQSTVNFTVENGILQGTFTKTLRGYDYQLLQSIQTNTPTQVRQYYVQNFIESGFDLQSFSIDSKERDSTNIRFIYTAQSRSLVHTFGNEKMLVSIIPLPINTLDVDSLYVPIDIFMPISYADSLSFVIPEHYSVHLPDNISISSDYGRYIANFYVEHNVVYVVKLFELFEGFYGIEHFSSFKEFLSKSKRSDIQYFEFINNVTDL